MNSIKNILKILWLGVLIVAVVFIGCWEYWLEDIFNEPVNLAVTNESSYIINTRFSDRYSVALAFDKYYINERLACDTSPSEECRELLRHLDIDVLLFKENNNILSEPMPYEGSASLIGNRFYITLGYFRGAPGNDLKLTFRNNNEDLNLNKLNPLLTINGSSIQAVNRAFYLFFIACVGGLVLIIAVLTHSIYLLKRKRNA